MGCGKKRVRFPCFVILLVSLTVFFFPILGWSITTGLLSTLPINYVSRHIDFTVIDCHWFPTIDLSGQALHSEVIAVNKTTNSCEEEE